MAVNASWQLRLLYVLAVLSAIIPFGMSGWVALTMGQSPMPVVPYLGPIALLFVGFWRIYLVARYPGTLHSYVFDAGTKTLRILGIIAMVVGVIYLLMRFGAGPLVRLLMGGRRTESGIEFYIVGVYLAFISGVGPLGILLFEASRVFGFEQHYRKQRNETSIHTVGS